MAKLCQKGRRIAAIPPAAQAPGSMSKPARGRLGDNSFHQDRLTGLTSLSQELELLAVPDANRLNGSSRDWRIR